MLIPTDVIPLDMYLRIEDVASRYPLAHILMSADVSTAVNTGFIVVRGGSGWARSFLELWLSMRNAPGVVNEQLGFEAAYNSRAPEDVSERIAILPPHILNSIASPMGEQLPHHKVGELRYGTLL